MSGDPVRFAHALADDHRQQILRLLWGRELCVRDLVQALGLSQPTVSHHLRVLQQAGLLRAREAGRQTFYTLDLDALDHGLRALRLALRPTRRKGRRR
ncbi:ArsR/SmtB family transcription factor [Thermoflexus sp.]|uniref:ArsR/SmtB family transcription factor n=1 Tax=Thermoflexus sp. TaxID=1969742 RepID=UPI0025FA1866|nr:metalloregulator ArsR/SmtB family transcription factor [Thermoflexus sp.]MCS6963890.1 metalloregulator ArsR/SmtB family transcription factor [Thermoflexus sp.]MCX7691047.1 metalloregulator ArsR/SmtB family transcription factor [Thermoflexus sp.]